jgi:4-hydroxy-2-oxoheptanedioate aldolase
MLTEQIRLFKDKLRGGYVLGPFAKTCDPGFIEILGYGGFDFVIIDLEHGPNTIQTAQDLVRAAQISRLLPIVRVKERVPSVIGEALDIGAGGIHVPQITSAEDARRVMERAKFAPEGMRGVCRFVRAGKYSSMDKFQYFKEANEAVIIVGLEGTEAIEKVDEIIAVDGVDIVFELQDRSIIPWSPTRWWRSLKNAFPRESPWGPLWKPLKARGSGGIWV